MPTRKEVAAAKIAEDPDYYRKLGRKGRKKTIGNPSGFALNRDRAIEAGRKGGIQKGINHRKRLQKRATISSK